MTLRKRKQKGVTEYFIKWKAADLAQINLTARYLKCNILKSSKMYDAHERVFRKYEVALSLSIKARLSARSFL